VKLQVLRAHSISAAMAELRATLGEDAVLLDTRELDGVVEVTAAIPAAEDEPWQVHHQRSAPPECAPLPTDAPLLLVGQAGAGKTLSAVKLATRHVLAGRTPLLVATDQNKAGALDQLAACMRVLGLGFVVAGTAAALAKAIARAAPGQPVLVDTAACNPFELAQARGLLPMLAHGRAVLVQPAGLCADEAREEAMAFQAMGVRHLLVTRTDIARRGASVLAAARTGLALTEAGTGPDPSRDLLPITAEWLAARWRDVSWN
jgi:flagellar biosynthesis protein FlhF